MILALSIALLAAADGGTTWQPLPECVEGDLEPWALAVGGERVLDKGATTSSPKVASVKPWRDGTLLRGVAPGWATVEVKREKRLVCIMPSDQMAACALPCGLTHFELSLDDGRVQLRGAWRSVNEWYELSRRERDRPRLELLPPPPAFVGRVLDDANAALELAGLKSRLSVASGWPLLENAPSDRAKLAAAAQALRPHLPVLHALLEAKK